MIVAAINRARAIPRNIALLKVITNKSTVQPIFSLTYDPRLPSIQQIQAKHWRSMKTQDTYLAEVFSQPPLTAFRKQRNIKDHIIRAQVARPQANPIGTQNGMLKCGLSCSACPYIIEKKSITINKVKWNTKKKLHCNSYNIIYLLKCNK